MNITFTSSMIYGKSTGFEITGTKIHVRGKAGQKRFPIMLLLYAQKARSLEPKVLRLSRHRGLYLLLQTQVHMLIFACCSVLGEVPQGHEAMAGGEI